MGNLPDSGVRTLVVRFPDDKGKRARVQRAIGVLFPFLSGMSMEDEMSIMDMLVENEGIPDEAVQAARESARALPEQGVFGDKG